VSDFSVMKKSQSAPSLYGSSPPAKRGFMIRRNAFSVPLLTETSPPSQPTEIVENLEKFLPASFTQKLTCIEVYGFPTDILSSKKRTLHEKEEALKDIASCMLSPEESAESIEKLRIRNMMEMDNVSAVEERFHRLLLTVRRNRRWTSQ